LDLKHIPVPRCVGSQLIKFIREDPKMKDMYDMNIVHPNMGDRPDCGSFAAWITQRKYFSNYVDYFTLSEGKWYGPQLISLHNAHTIIMKLLPGTMILLKNTSSGAGDTHLAVVLSETWSISKCGPGGPIVLTTAKQLMQIYRMNTANLYYNQ
jgi:hypothetical protein